jgi:glycosyltransferase involved in cell wall biosynthesis
MRPRKVVAVLHLADPSGPSRSLAPGLERLAVDAEVVVAVPSLGGAADELRPTARIVATGHASLVIPRSPRQAVALLAQMRADVRTFRELLRRERPDLVVVATTVLPAAVLAAWREGVPAIVYAAELYRQGTRWDRVRALEGRLAIRLNERMATVVVACSSTVAARFARPEDVVVVYPIVDHAVARGDAGAFRRRHGLGSAGPVIAMIGNITRARGQDVAIRALVNLRRDHPRAQLVIASRARCTCAGSSAPGTCSRSRTSWSTRHAAPRASGGWPPRRWWRIARSSRRPWAPSPRSSATGSTRCSCRRSARTRWPTRSGACSAIRTWRHG